MNFGITKGQSHQQCNEKTCGIEFFVDGKRWELEGDELVLCETAANSQKTFRLKGNPAQIISRLNEIFCGKVYMYGGELTHVPEKYFDYNHIAPIDHLNGGELIINKKNSTLNTIFELEGTPRQIASAISEYEGNGVSLNHIPGKAKIFNILETGGEITPAEAHNSVRITKEQFRQQHGIIPTAENTEQTQISEELREKGIIKATRPDEKIKRKLKTLINILSQRETSVSEPEQNFLKELLFDISGKVEYNNPKLEKKANSFGITDKRIIKELAETSIVIHARQIAQGTESISEKYSQIVELYQSQVNLSFRTSDTLLLQQYSTPAPIAYLMGIYCGLHQSYDVIVPEVISAKKVKESTGSGYKMFKGISSGIKSYHYEVTFTDGINYESQSENDHGYGVEFDRNKQIEDAIKWYKRKFSGKQESPLSFFEPSAGNGMLTIAANPQNFIVNELDAIRLKNLKLQGYKQVLNKDASKPFAEYTKKFDAIITNPPFGSIDPPIYYDEYPIASLEQLCALRALDTMKDGGKAAIIIGGHTEWDSKGRIQAGKNRIFFSYLYKNYNVDDVINIDSKKLYSRMGTGFNVRIILIDGRKQTPGGFPPLKNDAIPVTQSNSSKTISTFDELYQRITNLL